MHQQNDIQKLTDSLHLLIGVVSHLDAQIKDLNHKIGNVNATNNDLMEHVRNIYEYVNFVKATNTTTEPATSQSTSKELRSYKRKQKLLQPNAKF